MELTKTKAAVRSPSDDFALPVRGSNSSETMEQNPDIKIAPNARPSRHTSPIDSSVRTFYEGNFMNSITF